MTDALASYRALCATQQRAPADIPALPIPIAGGDTSPFGDRQPCPEGRKQSGGASPQGRSTAPVVRHSAGRISSEASATERGVPPLPRHMHSCVTSAGGEQPATHLPPPASPPHRLALDRRHIADQALATAQAALRRALGARDAADRDVARAVRAVETHREACEGTQ